MKHFDIRQVIPPIRVHVWGGFGSQLFALVVAWRVSNRFWYRRIQLIFHTSGVTERSLELPRTWLNEFSVLEVRDFSQSKADTRYTALSDTFRLMRNLIPAVLVKCGALSRGNSDLDLESLKPWLLEVRGHYTQFRLDKSEILRMIKLMEVTTREPELNQLSIHYRLGDLLSLPNKTYIQPNRIRSTLIQLSQENMPIAVFSDSDAKTASEVLGPLLGDGSTSYLQMSPIDTVRLCVNSEVFLGSNSKLSLWIAIFRSILGRKSAVPHELLNHLKAELTMDVENLTILVY